jgi:Domain of unknown function (DUF4349)
MPMPTEIRFLQDLERDLSKIADTEQQRERSYARASRRSRLYGWLSAAAVLLGVAVLVGGLVQLGGGQSSSSSSGGSGRGRDAFSTVGSAAWGGALDPSLNGKGSEATDFAGASQPEPTPASAAPSDSGGSKTDLTKIVRDGAISVSIERGQFANIAAKVVTVARRNGGEVLSSTTTEGISGTFTLRIPAAHFDEAMVELAALGMVDSSEIHGQDVTADYLDAKAHLKILYARRKFLFGLMAKASTQSQSLTARRQLEQTQLQIDKITGQLRYLNNQVAISTIKVDVHEPGAAPVGQEPTDTENPSLGHAFDRAVHGFLSVLGAMVIGLGYLIPLLVLGAIVYSVVWLARRRRRSR